MKRYLFFVFVLLLVFSCEKDTDNPTDPDYSVLGITSVTINDLQISVNGGSLLDVDQIESITVDGLENQMTRKHIQLSYIVLTNTDTDMSIEVESCHSDVSVTYNQEANGSQITYVVVVTREGYEEQVTYLFHRIFISNSK